jgi:hypothetical protein
MKTTPWNKEIPDINTKGIDSIKDKYLKMVSESSIDDLTITKAKKLFMTVIKDYKVGTLSSDELADFGFKLFHRVAKKYPKSDLFQASLSASDLTFEMRAKGERVPQCLRDIFNFYNRNK